MSLGTILPDPKKLAAADRHADSMRQRLDTAARKSGQLDGCTRRVVGGEVRYYDTADQYAIVSRQGKVLWFAAGPDGDRRI